MVNALIPTEQQLYRKRLRDFKKQFRNFLMTSRFNNQTIYENERYRINHPKLGCIYSAPDPISQNIPIDSVLFVLEMNNDTNKISGIGMVRNRPIVSKYFVYSQSNYNRYVYVGKHRISRENMTEEEDIIMSAFDILCFKGNRHMKRGQGIKAFPADILYRCCIRLDLVAFISEMFKKRVAVNSGIQEHPAQMLMN
jgi:hypothetical protein